MRVSHSYDETLEAPAGALAGWISAAPVAACAAWAERVEAAAETRQQARDAAFLLQVQGGPLADAEVDVGDMFLRWLGGQGGREHTLTVEQRADIGGDNRRLLLDHRHDGDRVVVPAANGEDVALHRGLSVHVDEDLATRPGGIVGEELGARTAKVWQVSRNSCKILVTEGNPGTASHAPARRRWQRADAGVNTAMMQG